jgi:hypothetical protein
MVLASRAAASCFEGRGGKHRRDRRRRYPGPRATGTSTGARSLGDRFSRGDRDGGRLPDYDAWRHCQSASRQPRGSAAAKLGREGCRARSTGSDHRLSCAQRKRSCSLSAGDPARCSCTAQSDIGSLELRRFIRGPQGHRGRRPRRALRRRDPALERAGTPQHRS